jgi:hypothetical protein
MVPVPSAPSVIGASILMVFCLAACTSNTRSPVSQVATSSALPSAPGLRAATTGAAQPTAPPPASSDRPSYKPCAPGSVDRRARTAPVASYR